MQSEIIDQKRSALGKHFIDYYKRVIEYISMEYTQ